MKIDFSQAEWLHKPAEYFVSEDQVTIETEPTTDFWQRSYYGFRNNNAPALLLKDDLILPLPPRLSLIIKLDLISVA